VTADIKGRLRNFFAPIFKSKKFWMPFTVGGASDIIRLVEENMRVLGNMQFM